MIDGDYGDAKCLILITDTGSRTRRAFANEMPYFDLTVIVADVNEDDALHVWVSS